MAATKESETLDHRLSLDLYALQLRLASSSSEDMLHAIHQSGLTLVKLKLLHILARPHGRPPRINRVARLLGIEGSWAARLVHELEEERLVDVIADEDDARARLVVITPAGRDVLERIDKVRVGRLEAFVRELTASEKKALGGALDLLLERPEIRALRPAE